MAALPDDVLMVIDAENAKNGADKTAIKIVITE